MLLTITLIIHFFTYSFILKKYIFYNDFPYEVIKAVPHCLSLVALGKIFEAKIFSQKTLFQKLFLLV